MGHKNGFAAARRFGILGGTREAGAMGGITSAREGVVLTVRVVPRSSRNAVQGWLGDALKVRLTAPPVDGKANRALGDFLAERLGVPRSRIRILSGDSGRTKRVLVEGASEAAVRAGIGDPSSETTRGTTSADRPLRG
jgi:hypothetical protein